MESSSEDSFAWTDTSSDSLDSCQMAVDNSIKSSDKQKKQKEISTSSNYEFQDSESKTDIMEEQTHYGTKSNSKKKRKIKLESESDNDLTKKKKKIKLEPESDYDVSKIKKKIKHIKVNGNENTFQDPYDETHLHTKVKEEESVSSSSTKQKKKKLSSSSDADDLKEEDNNKESDSSVKCEVNNESTIRKSKKKKKKSKKKYDSDNNNLETEDNIDDEESVTNIQKNSEKSNKLNNKHSISSATENNTFEEESEESSYENISAIKCVDDHNPHTLSFFNKSKEDITINSVSENTRNRISDSDVNSETKKRRNPRLSDRIQFEDEDDTNIEPSHFHESDYGNSQKSSRLKQFVNAKPNFKLLPQKLYIHSSITLDDEIWILKCPKDIEINAFNDTTLNIHGKCKVKVSGQTYDGSIEEEQADTIALLTMDQSKYQIKNLPLNGIIHLRKRIPKAHFRDDNVMFNNQTNFIPLPETKCRHPLFGSNYKKALKIPSAIAERLNVQDRELSLIKTEKRKKKKNKKDRERNMPEEVDTLAQDNSKMKLEVIEVTEEKKKKKRKYVDDDGPEPKKVKRIKHDPESAEAWESEKAIEENLFNF